VKATVKQIHELEEAGCELIRSAVPDADAAEAMAEIKKQIHIPLIADIHFHYKLALTCLEGGIDCLRLNPGNLRMKTRCVKWSERPKHATFQSESG
jgi:(E)-4-hydroxy-3-methylbut-2-enyl-diphosphate synthase